MTMAYGLLLPRLEFYAFREAGHRPWAMGHSYSISEHTTVPFLQLAMREGYFCMSV